MPEDQALKMMARLSWNSFLIAATLVVGLLVSAFQVVTQLQEMSLGYVPKLAVAGVVIVLLAPWMLSRFTGFAVSLLNSIPARGFPTNSSAL